MLRVAVTIALVGDHNDAYPSHRELDAARVMLGPDVVTEWMATLSRFSGSGERGPAAMNLRDFIIVNVAPP